MLFYYFYVTVFNSCCHLSLKQIQREEIVGLQFTLSHTGKYVNTPISLHGWLPSIWYVHCVTISCPMLVTQVRVTQGLGNGSQVYDC